MNEKKTVKILPYGISDFKTIMFNNYAYVDKTRYIEMLEKESNPSQFFFRPRKFGKRIPLKIYCKVSDTETEIDAKRKEALVQINKYIHAHRIKDRPGLKATVIIFIGKDKFEIIEVL